MLGILILGRLELSAIVAIEDLGFCFMLNWMNLGAWVFELN